MRQRRAAATAGGDAATIEGAACTVRPVILLVWPAEAGHAVALLLLLFRPPFYVLFRPTRRQRSGAGQQVPAPSR